MKEASASPEGELATALAAADDARLRSRSRAILLLVLGVVLVAGSLLFWPRGLFALIDTGAIASLLLIAGGGLVGAAGVVLVANSVRRITRLRHSLNSLGKPHEGFVNEPDYGMPTIGIGHGSSMDASLAKFANPGKLMPGRDR